MTNPNEQLTPLPDYVARAYRRLTGKNIEDLPREVQERFRLLPPDAEWSDIEFALDPPPWARSGAARRRYMSSRTNEKSHKKSGKS